MSTSAVAARGTELIEVAREYLRCGWCPIPVPYCAKAPIITAWQDLRLNETSLVEYFTGHLNIGILVGEPSAYLTDIDLDAPGALALADMFLPGTGTIFGRASKPRAHRLYVCPIGTEKFQDVDGVMLVEIRSTGCQTIFPPSMHPSGEHVEWESDGEPARVDCAGLRQAVVHLAVAAMLSRHWPVAGARHDAALAGAGFLLRAGVDRETVAKIITAAARVAGDGEWNDRTRATRYGCSRSRRRSYHGRATARGDARR